MAVDTRSKRFSMMNFGDFEAHLFEADGTVDADDKYSLLGMYNGISKEEAVVPVGENYRGFIVNVGRLGRR